MASALSASQLLVVAAGSAAGGVLRWLAGSWLNPLWSGFALGTLAVNVLGGLLIGIAMGGLSAAPNETARLLVVTGFLGGFTTFSAFSFESLALLQAGRPAMALLHAALHLVGGLAAAAIGWWAVRAALS